MTRLLQKFQDKVIIFVDDLVVVEETPEKCLELWNEVLQTLEDHSILLSVKKVFALRKTYEYMGMQVQVVDGKIKICPSPKRLMLFRRFSVPTDKAMLSKILGASIFVARGLPAYAAHVQTLEDALKQTKDKDFKLTPEQIRSFEKLKHILDNAQTLDVLNTSVNLEVYSDSSAYSVGSLAIQWVDGKMHIIGWMSKKHTLETITMRSMKELTESWNS